MTGVIVRSSANVQAGGVTRLSAMLHGTWILGFVALLPWLLREIPMATLAAVLVVTGLAAGQSDSRPAPFPRLWLVACADLGSDAGNGGRGSTC